MTRGLAVWVLLSACSGGDPVDDTDVDVELPDIEDAVYELRIGGMNVPGADPGLVDVMKVVFVRPVLLHTSQVTARTMKVRVALGKVGVSPSEQDPCLQTVDLPDAAFDGLSLSMGPRDTWLETPDGILYGIEDMRVTGAVTADGERLTSVALTGGLDVRQAEGFADFGTAPEICDQVGELGLDCRACDDGEPYCVDLDVRGFTADRVDAVVVPVEQADPAFCSR